MKLSWMVVGLITGVGLGAWTAVSYVESEYEANLALEVEKSKRYYDRLHKREKFSDPIAMVEDKALTIAEGISVNAQYIPPKVNIFKDPPIPGDFDLGEEIKKRNEDRPYIITEAEYFENSTDYTQVCLQWYSFDKVLSTQGDEELTETDEIVGDENLLRFGHGSNDANIVYVRNDGLEKEFEVIRIKGGFGETVHGELQHSDRKRKVSKKLRRDDE